MCAPFVMTVMMKSIVTALCMLIGCVFAQTDHNMDIGNVMPARTGYGAGTHYVYNMEFDVRKPTKLLTTITKGNDKYFLKLSSNLVFEVVSSPENFHQISLKFKMDRTDPERYLADIVLLGNDEIMIAITNIQYGYDFIRFKKDGAKYLPYMYAIALGIKSVAETSKNKAKEVGFGADGSFYIKKNDDVVDIYVIPVNPHCILENGSVYKLSEAKQYDNGLPKRLRIE